MRLSVTIGFDDTFVVRTLASLGPVEELYLLYAVTGAPEDSKSEATARDVVKVVRKGTPVAIDLRDLATAFSQVAGVNFDTVALAGGPRALVVITLTAAMVKDCRIYLVPEYQGEVIDATSLLAVKKLYRLPKGKLEVLTAIEGRMKYGEVAEKVGLHPTTVHRYLEKLEEVGLVRRAGKRSGEFETDKLTKALAKAFLNSRKQGPDEPQA
ncbi:MAG: CRISPR-associated CARF protein Csa3 [Pyrobaculum sp.]